MQLKSYAKLNLGLNVLSVRLDGYHQIKTVFCIIDLYDSMSFEVNYLDSSIQLVRNYDGFEYTADLIYKAAHLLQRKFNVATGVIINITKNIPIGGGLGGGSSNAASTLRALNILWKLNLSESSLLQLAATLGADVTVFITNRHALARGIGDELTYIDLRRQYFVIVYPNLIINTARVFADSVCYQERSLYDLMIQRDNDLTCVILHLYPELIAVMDTLRSYGTPLITGTGSCIYMAYDDKLAMENVYHELLQVFSDKNYIIHQAATLMQGTPIVKCCLRVH